MLVRVQLVDTAGSSLGHSTVEEAHRSPGRLHRAFSAVLHDGRGSVLFQTRSMDKERWPGHLANSCCGHPDSASSLLVDCRQRIREELGLEATNLAEVGSFEYRAAMPRSSWVEWEFDHVIVGQVDPDAAITPDPAEVGDHGWLTSFAARDIRVPLSPWAVGVLRIAAPHVPDFAFS
jgi:isopentenyl-diphosphate delta-isomerase